MSMKNPLTPAGIEPATFRFVAQHFNHCATAAPPQFSVLLNKKEYLNEPGFKARFGSPAFNVNAARGLTGIFLPHPAVKRHSA